MNAYALANAERFKVCAPDATLLAMVEQYAGKLNKLDDPNHGKVDVIEKNDARKTLEKAIRTYVQGFLAKNPNVTNADRENMALPVYDTTPTTVGNPQGQATADIAHMGGQILQLHIKHVSGTPSDAKANYGCKIYYGLFADGDKQPANGEDLTKHKFTRRKKEIFEFTPADVKKTAYFAIRYENSKGKAGPWGPMFSALIP